MTNTSDTVVVPAQPGESGRQLVDGSHAMAQGSGLWTGAKRAWRSFSLNFRVPGAALDLGNIASQDSLIRDIDAAGVRWRGLIHSAAVLRRRASIDEVTEENWDLHIEINLKPTFFLDRAIAEFLIKQGSGDAIVDSTAQGLWSGGFGGSVVYAATTGGIVSMSRRLARSLAPHQIRVNTLAPGFVDAPMMRIRLSEEELAANVTQVPLGRRASPEGSPTRPSS